MRTAFADTFYFLALVNASDTAHAKAVAFTSTYQGRLLTTEWVLVELADALAASPKGRAEFLSTRADLLADPDVVVLPCEQALLEEGIQLYSQRPDKEWSLTDCISFVVMRRESLTEALTGDRHFEQAGFNALLK
jgi:predicted nucleic acid-binding protein